MIAAYFRATAECAEKSTGQRIDRNRPRGLKDRVFGMPDAFATGMPEMSGRRSRNFNGLPVYSDPGARKRAGKPSMSAGNPSPDNASPWHAQRGDSVIERLETFSTGLSD